jgi:hypothetical protein
VAGSVAEALRMVLMKIFGFKKRLVFIKCASILLASLFNLACSVEKLYNFSKLKPASEFEQMDFKDMVERYLQKEEPTDKPIEGIYSVSILITKKYKPFLSSRTKEKILFEAQNVSTVALIKENNPNKGREYIEIPVDKERLPSYSVRGEFAAASDAGILIYKHYEKNGKVLAYTFSSDLYNNLLEGVRTDQKRSSTLTYKLSYLKLFPKPKKMVAR